MGMRKIGINPCRMSTKFVASAERCDFNVNVFTINYVIEHAVDLKYSVLI